MALRPAPPPAADVDRWWRGTAKLSKTLEGAPLEVVAQVRVKLEEFQGHLPLIAALRNPGMRDRHWERISQVGRLGRPQSLGAQVGG